jgi:hypothetical protein
MNKKAAKAYKKGYREAGHLYWTDEMASILKEKNRELRAYRVGFLFSLAFALGVAAMYARVFW